MDDIAVLQDSLLFADVPESELKPLVRRSRRFDFRPGQPLWLQGGRADALFVIGEGHVKSFRISADGQQIVLWIFGPGDSTGEPALFLPAGIRGTSSEAVERTTGLAIPGPALLDFLDTHPVVNRRMLRRLSQMLWDSHAMPSEFALQDVPGRVAQKLLELAAVHGVEVHGSTRIGVRLSQGTLAEMVAASRENVNRALARLFSEDIVSHRDGHFAIHDRARLQDRAHRGSRSV